VALITHVRWSTASSNISTNRLCPGGYGRTHLVEIDPRLGSRRARISHCLRGRLPTATPAAVKVRVFCFIDWSQAGSVVIAQVLDSTIHRRVMPSPNYRRCRCGKVAALRPSSDCIHSVAMLVCENTPANFTNGIMGNHWGLKGFAASGCSRPTIRISR
jgi:hypothetical protein